MLQGKASDIIYELGCFDAACEGSHLIPAARRAAAAADVVILIVGLSQEQEKEGRDRTSLRLPGHQEALVSAVVEGANGVKIVLVILSGGPLDVSFANNDPRVQSIIWAGYPGQAGGQAIAEVIFGKVNPGKYYQMWNYFRSCWAAVTFMSDAPFFKWRFCMFLCINALESDRGWLSLVFSR